MGPRAVRADRALDLVVVDPRPEPGRGVAYANGDRRHLLNVPAGGMSALPDDPGHLVDWLRAHGHADATPADFVPRADYGSYLQDTLAEALRNAPSVTLEHRCQRVRHARPVPGALVEFWQANAGGRYRHKKETYLAAIDPNFGGCGRAITDEDGRYWFRTIKPGAYPWPNGVNDWRPSHIHFSVFGHGFAQRLITQMYFEGDPLIRQCPIVSTIADKAAIDQLTAVLDRNATLPMDALAYKFDIVLRGRRSTMFENRMEGN